VIAHRGASGHLPENTLPSYPLAVVQGADMIEIDLHRTRDAAVVITHDENLCGLGGRGEICDASLAEVRALDAGRGERVPLLAEVLDRFGPRIAFNLELKRGTRAEYPGVEAEALAAVQERGLLARTLFSSFYDPVLARLRELSSEARIALLLSTQDPSHPIERARRLGAEAINPWRGLASRELIEAAHAAGLAVYVFTVDEVDEMELLLARGVDGIFTNYPDRMRAILSPRG